MRHKILFISVGCRLLQEVNFIHSFVHFAPSDSQQSSQVTSYQWKKKRHLSTTVWCTSPLPVTVRTPFLSLLGKGLWNMTSAVPPTNCSHVLGAWAQGTGTSHHYQRIWSVQYSQTSIKLSIGLKLLVAIIHRIFTEPAVQSNGFQMVGLGGAGRVRMILKAWK